MGGLILFLGILTMWRGKGNPLSKFSLKNKSLYVAGIILLISTALAALWWLYTSHLTFTEVAGKAWENLFFFVIIAAVAAALLSWYPFTKERQWIARSWWMPGAVLGALLLAHWWTGKPATQHPEDAVAFESRAYVLTSNEVKIHGAPGDASSYGKFLCYSPEAGVEVHRHATSGGTYWTFRATKGDVVLRYQFMRTCPSDTF